MKEIQKRSISGLLFAVVLLGSIVMSPWSFMVLFCLFSIFILKEFYQLSKIAGTSPQKLIGLTIGGLIFLLTFLHVKGHILFHLTGIYLSLVFLIPAYELFRKKEKALENMAITLFGIFYIILPLSLLNYFVFPDYPQNDHYDPTLLVFLFILMWAYDSGAYFFGISFGKHKLFERISPKKSWEGFFGGWFLASICAIILNRLFPAFGLAFMLLMATIVTVTGTLGDLVESMIKRNIGVKDSGVFLPGHGGLLDRFDSILFASPFVYLAVHFLT